MRVKNTPHHITVITILTYLSTYPMQVETLRKAIEGAGFVEVKIEEKEEVRA